MNNQQKRLHNKLQYEGRVFQTNYDGEVIVLEYTNSKDILVQFKETGYQKKTQLGNMLSGLIKDESKVFTHNVEGIVYGDEVGRSKLPEYSCWLGVLERCYDPKWHEDKPTYKGCTVSNNFKQFPYFKEWCNNQIGFKSIDDRGLPFHLDKDILVKGNKQYNENVCVFIPHDINTLLLQGGRSKDNLPLGVSLSSNKEKYLACVNKGGISVKLGTFNTVEQAFNAYKEHKEEYIKEVANKWKDFIDNRVYTKLMQYETNIDD